MLASLGGSLLGFVMTPWSAILCVVSLAVACFGLAVFLLPFGLWFPVAVPVVAAIASMVLVYLVRFLFEERRRHRVQKAFNHYLARALSTNWPRAKPSYAWGASAAKAR